MKKITAVAFMGLMLAMDILLTRIVPVIQVETLRISFGFLPHAFSSILLGPWLGGLNAAVGDIVGMAVAPRGPYFPGFTISAFLSGIIYGVFLYKKPKTIFRITMAVLLITLFVDIGLNTYWLTLLYGYGFLAILPARIIKSAALVPVNVSIIYLMWRYAGVYAEGILLNHSGSRTI